mgnify:CR=1 FL=1
MVKVETTVVVPPTGFSSGDGFDTTAKHTGMGLTNLRPREAASLVTNPKTVLIDASTAHRVAPGWAYGFPELSKTQRATIAGSKRISNPGCYPTGFLALVRPIVDAGLAPADWPFTLNAVSGYSGGGKAMIAEFENESDPTYTRVPYRIYAMAQKHKHVPEMQKYAGLTRAPIFAPSVGRYYKGMIVEVPVPLAAIANGSKLADVHGVLTQAYKGERFVSVAPLAESAARGNADGPPRGPPPCMPIRSCSPFS